MKKILAIALVGFISATALLAQKQHPNALKFDFVGPFIMFRTGHPIDFPWKRLGLKYERRLAQYKFLSLVCDGEYRSRIEHFQIDGDQGQRLDHGFSHQHEFSILPGLRLFLPAVQSKHFEFVCFLEPRFGPTFRYSKLEHHDNLNDFERFENVTDIGFVPRLRSGIGFRFGSTIGLEISGDLGRYKILGDNRHQWEIFPELSLVVWF